MALNDEGEAPVLVDRDGAVLIISINRPHRRNAVNRDVSVAIAAALDDLDSDPGLSVAIITGTGGQFSSGMDLKDFVAGARPELPGRGFAGVTERPPVKPLIAAVEGFALAGGFELALACDLIVAGTGAQFGLPEVSRGLVAGSGGMVRLAQRMPFGIALEYVLTGQRLAAPEAYRLGLVNRLTEDGQALQTAIDLAKVIAANAPLSVAMAKRIMNEARDWLSTEVWERQRPLAESVIGSEDAQEGARAFAEKRVPIWSGR
ncbi:crotonase/enoyl-CoA hydratase family protein [Sphingomonas sp. ID0503]|uniref:crotonase/enoyl-CoA hydratase family protein n=1 Tax=Sphingomonas sp. ID0503 TaxID=3399691 RepID=UPI003AFA4FE3